MNILENRVLTREKIRPGLSGATRSRIEDVEQSCGSSGRGVAREEREGTRFYRLTGLPPKLTSVDALL
jgi:hypothetical protein